MDVQYPESLWTTVVLTTRNLNHYFDAFNQFNAAIKITKDKSLKKAVNKIFEQFIRSVCFIKNNYTFFHTVIYIYGISANTK